MLDRLKSEPARIGALITALVALLVDIGLDIDPNIALRVTALVAILFGEGVRQQVYSSKNVDAEIARQVQAQDPQAPEKSESMPNTYADADELDFEEGDF